MRPKKKMTLDDEHRSRNDDREQLDDWANKGGLA